MRHLRYAAACIALIVITVLPARAETEGQRRVAETARAWGILGVWRIDCSDPKGNGLGYAVRDGVLMHERDMGAKKDTQEVLDARTDANGKLTLEIYFEAFKQTRRYDVIRNGDRIRAVSNTLPDGTGATIVDGRFVHNGQVTPWQSRCNLDAPAPASTTDQSGTSAGSGAQSQ